MYNGNPLLEPEFKRWLTEATDQAEAVHRSILVEKDASEDFFGFNLRTYFPRSTVIESDSLESRRTRYFSVISYIGKGMSAERAGLKIGDLVVAVDGELFTGYSHIQIVSRIHKIREEAGKCVFAVVDSPPMEWFDKCGLNRPNAPFKSTTKPKSMSKSKSKAKNDLSHISIDIGEDAICNEMSTKKAEGNGIISSITGKMAKMAKYFMQKSSK
ncbi:hypothetical protein PFISCL1PPCAC_25843 [Pristionchus fissidentatus]|uniref:PDZ domain-containing protein n=1 Tax=Pristionchus fissidentatus TaxID=1538716 RepID=A0AAV5WQH6_9BILA|nr:hypothetical protein PFISCL1PPCAC_25843 [Pristionchus fissidentatus]